MPIFTPDNEPYLGRDSVFHLDQMIQVAMEKNSKIAPWTKGKELASLQLAGTEIIPHGFSIALSIRELIRQGYLLSAEILLRPFIERVAVISYLAKNEEELPLWEAGWSYNTRPALYKMLGAMNDSEETTREENEEIGRQITQKFNALVHADPLGARRQSINIGQDMKGYSASKMLNEPARCDDICFQASMYLIILVARAIEIYPEAFEPEK